MANHLSLRALPARLAVCRLDPAAAIPSWALEGAFMSITRSAAELSIVCEISQVPVGTRHEGPWQAFEVLGPLEFSLVGILAELSSTLANAKVSIFAISTYDTDYILVKEPDFNRACRALQAAEYRLEPAKAR